MTTLNELRSQADEIAAAGAAPVPSELVLAFNFGTLVKVVFQDRVLYEVVDLSPKSYWQVCWAHGWAGDYDSEEEARNECLSLCGYGRSIREVKPGDDGYKNPRQPKLTERRIPIYAAASAAPVPEPEGWQPIETAPKDGVELIGWRKDCGAILIRWTSCSELMTEPEIEQSGIDDATLFSEDWFCAGGRLEGCEIPTHWMSLPAAPKEPT